MQIIIVEVYRRHFITPFFTARWWIRQSDFNLKEEQLKKTLNATLRSYDRNYLPIDFKNAWTKKFDHLKVMQK